MDTIEEDRIRELARRVSVASGMRWAAAYEAIRSLRDQGSITNQESIRKQFDEILRHIPRKSKGNAWSRYDHAETELLTRPAPRLLCQFPKRESRRYRRIRRKRHGRPHDNRSLQRRTF